LRTGGTRFTLITFRTHYTCRPRFTLITLLAPFTGHPLIAFRPDSSGLTLQSTITLGATFTL
jgi:hypothetical protein